MRGLNDRKNKLLSCEGIIENLPYAAEFVEKQAIFAAGSNSNIILSRFNEFSLFRQDFLQTFSQFHPDEVFNSNFGYLLTELQMIREKEMISKNIQLMEIKQQEKKNTK